MNCGFPILTSLSQHTINTAEIMIRYSQMHSSATETAIDGVHYPESYAEMAGYLSSWVGVYGVTIFKDMPPASELHVVVRRTSGGL